jgi:radical SAM protein with 4Fe4S-binding SPASM domain
MQVTHDAPNQGTETPSLTGLDFLWLEITRKCNLRCTHCYAESSPSLPLLGSMRYEEWRDVLTEGYSLGCKSMQFIGGEPTLYPKLLQLISHARTIGYEFIEIFTNGTLLNDSLLLYLRTHEVRLAFSVYAASAKTHDDITQRHGSFEKTIESVRLALKHMLPVGIVAMESNLGEVDDTKRLLQGLGVYSIGVDRVRGIGRGGNFVPNHDPFTELCGSCWKGKLCIDPDGNAFPCVFSSFYSVGNVKNGLTSIMGNVALKHFRQKVRDQEQTKDGAVCDPDTCHPQTRPCSPDCAPACSPCVPDLRAFN